VEGAYCARFCLWRGYQSSKDGRFSVAFALNNGSLSSFCISCAGRGGLMLCEHAVPGSPVQPLLDFRQGQLGGAPPRACVTRSRFCVAAAVRRSWTHQACAEYCQALRWAPAGLCTHHSGLHVLHKARNNPSLACAGSVACRRPLGAPTQLSRPFCPYSWLWLVQQLCSVPYSLRVNSGLVQFRAAGKSAGSLLSAGSCAGLPPQTACATPNRHAPQHGWQLGVSEQKNMTLAGCL
jgi:hypothetical protein